MEDQSPARRSGVDRLGEGAEPDLALLQRLQGLDELLRGPGQAIQLPNRQGISGPRIIERRLELGPLTLRIGRLLHEDPCAACRCQCVELQLRILILGRDAGIPDQCTAFRFRFSLGVGLLASRVLPLDKTAAPGPATPFGPVFQLVRDSLRQVAYAVLEPGRAAPLADLARGGQFAPSG